MVPGHRVIARLDLLAAARGGLRTRVKQGNRSLLYEFEGLGNEAAERVKFGAVIDHVRSGLGDPGGSMVVELWFWIELAAIYATPGVGFDLWYAGRQVGRGQILELARED